MYCIETLYQMCSRIYQLTTIKFSKRLQTLSENSTTSSSLQQRKFIYKQTNKAINNNYIYNGERYNNVRAVEKYLNGSEPHGWRRVIWDWMSLTGIIWATYERKQNKGDKVSGYTPLLMHWSANRRINKKVLVGEQTIFLVRTYEMSFACYYA